MSNRLVIDNIAVAMDNRLFSTVTMWNRLEGRPRKADFSRALKAEIRDPLWMLTKQWQLGEFQGDDAGSPVFAKLHLATTRLNKYQAAGHPAQPFDNNTPLEGTVEQRPVSFVFEEKIYSLDLRLMLGRHWLKMLKKQVGNFDESYIRIYPIEVPDPEAPDAEEHAAVLAHMESWQRFAAAAGRKMDGFAFYKHLDDGGNASDDAEIPGPMVENVDMLGEQFVAWVDQFFLQPDQPGEDAWLPSRLEYQFACSAPVEGKEKVYEAEEYYTGKLDWFNLSVNDRRRTLGETEGEPPSGLEKAETKSFIPVPLEFEGMPNTRWWAFENRKTYLGDVKPDTKDIGKLLLMEFALIYANDWFLIPLDVLAGTISDVKGLMVTNVFGERTWIDPTGKGQDDDWQRWTMFTINRKGKGPADADNSLLMLPTVPKIQEGPALEQFAMVRDELANMVWAIETDILLPSGDRKKGIEAGRELFAFLTKKTGESAAEEPEEETNGGPAAPIRYQVMNNVPENWIPFIPIHKEGDNREIQLQRAAMPRIIPGDTNPPERVRPRTLLLREGLDKLPKEAYYIYEEEVPRAGIQVSQSLQRTRWYGGKVYKWLGVHKKNGRGEGSSGLAFDQIVPVSR